MQVFGCQRDPIDPVGAAQPFAVVDAAGSQQQSSGRSIQQHLRQFDQTLQPVSLHPNANRVPRKVR